MEERDGCKAITHPSHAAAPTRLVQSLSDIGKKLEDESHFWQRRLRELSVVEICDLNFTHRYRQNQILDRRSDIVIVSACDY